MPDCRKLLFYTHALTGGGAERVWALLASGFARRGLDVVFAVDFAAAENMSFLDPAVRLVVLGGGHLASTRRLARLLTEEMPDISVSALSLSNLKHAAAATMAGRRDRAILSYHGYDESEPQPLSRLGYWSTPLITRITAATIAVSEGLRDHVVTDYAGAASRIHRIYNPVVAEGLPGRLDESDLRQRGPVVLASGRMVSYKNFPGLVRAFARVAPADARLVILGQGETKADVAAEIVRLGLQDRVELPGYISEPWKAYRRACCFVSPSLSESFGMVVVEAMAHGLAIVANDCDGPREILEGGRFGTLVPVGDEDALAAAISASLAAPGDPAPRMRRAAEFSLDHGLDRYAELFGQVLARRGSRKAPVLRDPGLTAEAGTASARRISF